MVGGGTWRRLKIAAEVRLGHGVPPLPEHDLVKLLGLLASVRDGRGKDAVADEKLQEQAGTAERKLLAGGDLREACRSLAMKVDVRPFL